MIQLLKSEIKEKLEQYILDSFGETVSVVVEQPKNLNLGDISVPVFSLLKVLRKPLPEVVELVSNFLKDNFKMISEVTPTGGFVNIRINKEELCKNILFDIVDKPELVGKSSIGSGKNIVIDYSSPNIAKSFSVGHLRSTMIGNSLKLIYQNLGYNVTGINYLGDWGTQFGKMIVAYQKWGDKDKIAKDPINELTALYVKFHDLAKENPALEDEARAAFKRLEDGDKEYLELWKKIREDSLKESEQIYKILNVTFDSYNGEAYYNDKMEPVVKELEDKGLLEEDEGAKIVRLGEDIIPALIKRKDGGSLYITRDLAAIFDRKKRYNFSKILYVVGNEQKLHFEQLKRIITLMGYDFADEINHVNFGLVLKDGKKMSTRSGGVVKLYDVLDNAINLAYKQIIEKNPDLEDAKEVARKVGVGAVVFNDLKNHRSLDYDFDMDKMLKFEGQTGPYIQYTGVRIYSLLKKNSFNKDDIDTSLLNNDNYFELIRLLGEFKGVVEKACSEDAPSYIARYLLALCTSFNKFYGNTRILSEVEQEKNTNLLLSYATRLVINEGLRLLGMEMVDVM